MPGAQKQASQGGDVKKFGIANASPGDSREHTAAQSCMSRRAIKCAYGGEIDHTAANAT